MSVAVLGPGLEQIRAGCGGRQIGCAVVVMRHQRGAISSSWAMKVVTASSSLWSAFLPAAAHEALSRMPALGSAREHFGTLALSDVC
jgi:hypothetical protein